MATSTTLRDRASGPPNGNRAAMLEQVAVLDDLLAAARAGGGEDYVQRHRERGRLLPRERIARLLDADSPFLELQPVIGWGTEYHVGGSVVTGIGVIEDVRCVVCAHDPTVRGGATNPPGLQRTLRAMEIARRNRLPLVLLVESAGADLPSQADLWIPGGALFRGLTRLSAVRIPTICLVFGNSTAGGAYLPAMSDYSVFVDGAAQVFLGGPPLVRMATGQDVGAEDLGGARLHARVSGLCDYLAADESDAIRRGREIVRTVGLVEPGAGPTASPDPPRHDPEELLDIIPLDQRTPFDPRDVLARILDGSRFDEFKPLYGSALCTGWGSIHGYPIGILANARGVLFSEEAEKGAHFIQLANQRDVPLLFVHNTTGFMVGREYERHGIIKHGAMMINAVSNSSVPHIALMAGASYGAANYAMSGRAYDPRFVFAWPNAHAAVMGPVQLSGVLSIVSRQRAERRGQPFDEEADAVMRDRVERQIGEEETALANSARGYDDGIIDPRDTRTVLGLALAFVDCGAPPDPVTYGVFRT
jgi:acyl-CoA carboxylase subunit beta